MEKIRIRDKKETTSRIEIAWKRMCDKKNKRKKYIDELRARK